ncbi:MAG: DNA gyrase inhibitor YacG [Rubrivivax sp.]
MGVRQRDKAIGAGKPAREVPCPACQRLVLYSLDNPSRPFCSPRCKSLDLGAWASEGYRVEAQPEPDELSEGSSDDR